MRFAQALASLATVAVLFLGRADADRPRREGVRCAVDFAAEAVRRVVIVEDAAAPEFETPDEPEAPVFLRQYDVWDMIGEQRTIDDLAGSVGAEARVNVLEVRGSEEEHAQVEQALAELRRLDRGGPVLRIHPVADLVCGLTDFVPPQITQISAEDEPESPLFGGQDEEAPEPYAQELEDLSVRVRGAVGPWTWEDRLDAQGRNLVVYAPRAVQEQVAEFLDELREAASDPLAVLDDVTSGTGVSAAGSPS